jgi:hypothetical protein
MREYENGVTCHSGHNKTEKKLIIYRGEQCEDLKDIRTFIRNQLGRDATFSRLDLAVTVENGMSVSEFQIMVQEGCVGGALFDAGAKTIMNDKTTNAETVYIGDMKKRAKNGIFRCYDKALEQQTENENLTRFELEEHQKKAHVTAMRYADGMEIGDIIQQRVLCTEKLWLEIMGVKSDKLKRYKQTHIDENHDATWKWLIEVVAKSLGQKIADEIIKQDGTDNFGTFQKMLEESYNDRINELLNQKWFEND